MIVSNKNKKKYGKSWDRVTGKRRKYMLVLWFHQWGTFLFKTEWVYFNSFFYYIRNTCEETHIMHKSSWTLNFGRLSIFRKRTHSIKVTLLKSSLYYCVNYLHYSKCGIINVIYKCSKKLNTSLSNIINVFLHCFMLMWHLIQIRKFWKKIIYWMHNS